MVRPFTRILAIWQFVDGTGPELIPQIITIEQVDGSWSITNVDFFDPPAFCS